jgi:Domain of unknown function (DUF4129)
VGGARLPHQGPLAFAAQVIAARPDLKGPLQRLFAQYAQLRYGRELPQRAGEVEAFRRAVGRLRIPRQTSAA